jgi:hypothetical protein
MTAILVLFGAIALLWLSPVGAFIISDYQIKRHKEHLKNGIDRVAVRAACAELLRTYQEKRATTTTQPDEWSVKLEQRDPTIPPVLRDLPARLILLTDRGVRIDCGGGGFEDHYGILFSVDSSTDGNVANMKLIDHLYFWY